jgi:hypothetical protein
MDCWMSSSSADEDFGISEIPCHQAGIHISCQHGVLKGDARLFNTSGSCEIPQGVSSEGDTGELCFHGSPSWSEDRLRRSHATRPLLQEIC